ncbi:PH domain-containing protein [Microbacterium sp. 2FI]|uniref:PH domain-containing protein n=1 Tax=Microbacterium sp. 2FI TaxID=2502193 RepID=UPI0010F73D29|nr:PH domain-containing protein [Microbacterium sp. 2FI]
MSDLGPTPDATPPNAPPPHAPPRELVRSPLSDGEWHRLHPLTPLLRGGLVLLIVIGLVVANLRDRLIAIFVPTFGDDFEEYEEWESTGDPIDFVIANNLYLVAILAVLGVLIVVVAFFYLSWRFHTFRITDDDVEVRSGILFRTQRRAPLDRVQGVNLTRPMIARLLGTAKLEVVGAGTDSNVKLEYLSTSNAEAVRADILRLASGRRLAEAAARTDAASAAGATSRTAALGQTVSRGLTGLIEGDEAPVLVPDSVVHIPVGRLIASHIISFSTLGLIVAAVAVIIGVSQGVTWLIFGMVPAIIGFAAYWVRSIMRSLRYSIAPTPDGVRITFGLLTTITEIVPPGRVHAVEVTQPILWRPFGWWVVRINRLTGRSAADSSTDQFTTVLPVGTVADVERVLRLALPTVAEAEWPLIVREGMLGPDADDTLTTTPRRAWFVRPFSWKRNGFRLTSDVLLLRRGIVWRKLAILPLARLQSFALHQGPVDRMARIAGLRAHVVSGPVYANLAAIDRAVALALFEDVSRATVLAASDDRTHRWASDAAVSATDEADAAPEAAEMPAVAEAPAVAAPEGFA